ncbi:Uncharacterised protein [Legionella geestiana]|nr:Uncharacterised protein [Legionella geestiana]
MSGRVVNGYFGQKKSDSRSQMSTQVVFCIFKYREEI